MRLGVLSDLHWSDDPLERGSWHNPYEFTGVAQRIAEALSWFAEQHTDAIAILGDIAHRGDSPSLNSALAQFASAQASVLLVCGNHDLSGDDEHAETVPSVLSKTRVALASGEGQTVDGVRVAGVHVQRSSGWFGARLAEQPPVATWATDPVILLSHYPLLSRASLLASNGWPYPGDLLDRDEVEAVLLRRAAPTIVLSGHIHARDVHSKGAILQLTQGAVIEPPFDAAVVDVKVANQIVRVTRQTRRLSGPPAIREPVLAADEGSWIFDGERWTSEPVNTNQ